MDEIASMNLVDVDSSSPVEQEAEAPTFDGFCGRVSRLYCGAVFLVIFCMEKSSLSHQCDLDGAALTV